MTTKTQKNKTTEKMPPMLIAYVVTEREGKTYWTRRGAAWPTKEGNGLSFVEDNGARYVLLPPKTEQTQDEGGVL